VKGRVGESVEGAGPAERDCAGEHGPECQEQHGS